MSAPRTFTIHIDGAARGNPGPAAYGFVIFHDGKPILEESGYLGQATNNVAEYTALVQSLARAAELRGQRLRIHSDSELLVKQMRGEYRVKNPQLAVLFEKAKQLREQFQDVHISHVPREKNRGADRLCNEALDEAARAGKSAQVVVLGLPAASASRVKPGGDSLPSRAERWRAALGEAERKLRDAARLWCDAGLDSPSPHDVLVQIARLWEERGFLQTR